MDTIQGTRIRQLRLARGLTQAELAEATGGMITKQAISKYERGQSVPSAPVLNKIAEVFEVKTADLLRPPVATVEFVGYRKGSGLGTRKQEQVERLIAYQLEQRIRIQDLIGQIRDVKIPVQEYSIQDLEETEAVAEELRTIWELGTDPVAHLIDVLEDRHVHVIECEVGEDFDGISAFAKDQDEVIAAAVVTRTGIPGERQRLNLAHELGHLVQDVDEEVDEEKAAFRMGAALLAPRKALFRDVGRRRQSISPQELLLLKREYGLSLQALVYRLTDLDIISDHHAREWWKHFNRAGWRTSEPNPLQPEKPKWLRQHVIRAYAEDMLEKEEAERLLGEIPSEQDRDGPMTLIRRDAFMERPLEERRNILAQQAEEMKEYYEEEDRSDWQSGEVSDYE